MSSIININSSSSTAQACSACKYQRRKCAHDCILAPYFPRHRQRQFLNAHKLFGVSNITKLIRHLSPPLKDHAMRTLIFESEARASDPVGGCFRIISDLHRQIQFTKSQLDIVLHQLSICRANALPNNHLHLDSDPNLDCTRSDDLGSCVDPPTSYDHLTHQDFVSLQDVNSWTSVHEGICDGEMPGLIKFEPSEATKPRDEVAILKCDRGPLQKGKER